MTGERTTDPVKNNIAAVEGSNQMAMREVVRGQVFSAGELEDLKARARAIARQLEEARGSKELEIIDSLAGLGLQAQRQAASELGLLKARVKQTLDEGDPTGRVATDLVELRVALKQIAPVELNHANFFDRLVDILPFRQRLLRLLGKIAIRYEPVSRQIVVIETRLRQGRLMLARDNLELRKLYEQVELQQPLIQKNVCFGELLMHELEALLERTEEVGKKEKIHAALHDVAMRVQDLRAMAEVHAQYFASIDITRQNNTRLGQAVERTLTLAANIVSVGLAIHVALARQRRVLEATQHTRAFLGNMIVVNAAAIKRHTQEIGDVYKEPVIAVEKITEAHNALLEAIDMVEHLRREGIAAARENMLKLSCLAGTLEQRITALAEPAGEKPIEA